MKKNEQFVIFNPSSFYICSINKDNQYIVQLNAPSFETNGELYIPINNLVTDLRTLKLFDSFIEDEITYLKKCQELNTDEKLNIKDFDFSENIPDFNFIGNPSEETSKPVIINKEDYVNKIISGEEIAPKLFSENNVITVSAVFKNTLQASKDAFEALEPSKNMVIYLEPSITAPKILKKELKKNETNNFPPNVYIVPKGLIRRGIDKN